MKTNTCVVCNSRDCVDLILRIKSDEAAKTFLKNWNADGQTSLESHITKLWESDECEILKCRGCGSRFGNPHVAGDSKFYNWVTSKPDYPNSRWEFELAKNAVTQLTNKNERFLEIGAGSGRFVESLLDIGIDASLITVTEFSAQTVKTLKGYGVNVQSVDFREGVTGGPFAFIFLFQTLEHLDRLDEAIASLSELSSSGAHAFISVPNIDYIEWAELNLGEIDMPPNHITGFSGGGLTQLFSRNGWNLVNLELQTRNTWLARCKFGAMRGLQYPKNGFQKMIRGYLGIGSKPYGRIKLLVCSGILLLSDWTLLEKAPAENLFIHVEKKL